MEALVHILRNSQLNESRKDCIQWRWSKDLNFSGKLAYSKQEDQKFCRKQRPFFFCFQFGGIFVLQKWKMFVWMALQGCIASISGGILNESLDICRFCNFVRNPKPHSPLKPILLGAVVSYYSMGEYELGLPS